MAKRETKKKEQPRAKAAVSAIDRAICAAVKGFSDAEYLEVMEEIAGMCQRSADAMREEHPELED